MRVVILHNAVSSESLPDEKDVIVQADSISIALAELGHESIQVPCDLNLTCLKQQLTELKPDRVFNLVESLDGRGRLIHMVPSFLDVQGFVYTGSSAESILMTSNKVMAKKRMLAKNLPTPAWIGPWPEDLYSRFPVLDAWQEKQWIIKSLWEHASLGLDEDGLITVEHPKDLIECLRSQAVKMGGNCFAEEYIDGREFNLSVLAGPHGPEVLPPAEIIFEGYEKNKPRIVGYRAKWDEASYEFWHTNRQFAFPMEDESLLKKLKETAIQCWRIFGLGGYARVDFRVDHHGKVWILEVNTNPCISPDAGFAAAVKQAGMTISDAVGRILNDTMENGKSDNALCCEPYTTNLFPIRSDQPISMCEPCFQYEVRPSDIDAVRKLAEASGFFYPSEVDVAGELVEERLSKGVESGYHFVLYEKKGRLIGFSCYGPIPCTISSYDIYWIVVHPDFQGKGLGKTIIAETERLIQKAKGTQIYIDTSHRQQYDSTRKFYEHCGYGLAALLEDFYAPKDGKAIYSKIITNE